MTQPARVLCADPPWKFKDSLPGRTRGASKQYQCMSTDDLCRIVLPPIADNSVLFLWRVASMQADALRVIDAWGFTLKSEITWVKTTKRSSPDAGATKLAFGMGRQVRACHEVCLIATRGKCPPKSRSIRSVFFAPLGRHSEKPEVFYEIVEALHEGPYTELFARRQRDGWSCIGSELGTMLEVA